MILLALGGAACVWEDLEAAQALLNGREHDTGAVNDMIGAYPGDLTLAATLHPEKAAAWVKARERNGGNMDFALVCHKAHHSIRADIVTSERWSGSSGLYIVQVALMVYGYERVICCGIPMDGQPHYFDSRRWSHHNRYQRGWREAVEQPELRGKVRSMSGYSRELVGYPDHDWLAGGA